MLTLSIKERGPEEDIKKLREAGEMPAVFYGPKEKSTPIKLLLGDFERAWKQAGESTILSLDGVGENKDVLIHDVDVHPVTGIPRHADFYVIERGKKIDVKVPLEFVGESPAEKELGGVLMKVLHEINIEALPKDLPHEIKADISSLKDFGSQITVADLVLPEGVTALDSAEEVVALVAEPKEEEIPEEKEEADISEIEVEEKGKEGEETVAEEKPEGENKEQPSQ